MNLLRFLALLVVLSAATLHARDLKWITTWTASVQGPYPTGNASAQPELLFAFPTPAAGARDQTFRLIVQPDLWGSRARLRFSNVFGARPVNFDGVFAGLHQSAGAIVPHTNRAVRFAGKPAITIAPGEAAWSDPIDLAFGPNVTGRKLAISFHIAGESGPMTWHAKALTTSYLTAPGAGAKGQA